MSNRVKQVLYISVLVFTVALLTFSFFAQKPADASSGTIEKYYINGEYSLTGADFKPLNQSNIDEIKHSGNKSSVVIKGHFDKEISKNEQIIFRLENITASVDVNGKNILDFSNASGLTKSPGNVVKSIISDGITPSDNVEIHLQSVYANSASTIYSDFLGNINVGQESAFIEQLLLENALTLTLAATMIFYGIMLLILSFIAKKYRQTFSGSLSFLSVAIIFLGIFNLINYPLASYVLPYPDFITIMQKLGIYTASAFLMLYFTTWLTGVKKIILNIFFYSYAAFTLGTVFLQAFRIMDIYETLTVFITMLAVTLPVALFCIIYESAILHNNYSNELVIGLIFILCGGGAEIINYFFEFSQTGVYLELGIFAFVIFQTLFIAHIIKRNLKKLNEAVETEKNLAQSRIALMLSQIKPHFIYNALNAISGLCLTDPEKADEAIFDFSQYLRSNIDSLQQTEPIPFKEELDHIKHYIKLEQMRFGERVKVVYDINYSDFRIPTLTLQPIVENAVKHGICKKENGGTVRIRTVLENPDTVLITVSDNGEGFSCEPDKQSGNDNHICVGMQNVKSRLMYKTGAVMDVKSKKGVGTTVAIELPINKDTEVFK